jgi:hypothetical protein
MTAAIRHVCFFRLKRELSAAEHGELRRFATDILASDAGVLTYRFAANGSRKAAGFGLILDSTFASPSVLADYVRAPLHDALAAFIDGFVEQTIVADFASEG